MYIYLNNTGNYFNFSFYTICKHTEYNCEARIPGVRGGNFSRGNSILETYNSYLLFPLYCNLLSKEKE